MAQNSHWRIWIEKETKRLRIRFNIINPTHLPVDLENISLEVAIMSADPQKEESPIQNEVLPPDNPRIIDTVIDFGDRWIGFLKTNDPQMVIVGVKCTAIFRDARHKQWEQTFERYLLVTSRVLDEDPTKSKMVTPVVRTTKNSLRAKERS
jgi:hypothetical protein